MKNRVKRILAMILAMVMVATIPGISMAEEIKDDSKADLMTLLPIKEVAAYVDLTEFSLKQLAEMTAYELFSHLKDVYSDEPIEIDATGASVWANFIDDEGQYKSDVWEVIGFDESINILDIYDANPYNLEVIIGSGNQLDAENVRYSIDFRLPTESAQMDLTGYIYDALYDFSAYDIVKNMRGFKVMDAESVEILWDVETLAEAGYKFDADNINGWINLGYDDSVKFAPTPEETLTCDRRWDNSLRMIIKSDGETAMYNVYAQYPSYMDVFDYSVFAQDKSGKRKNVAADDTYIHEAKRKIDGETAYFYNMYTQVPAGYSYDDELYLGVKLNKDFAHCDLKVIKGWEHSDDTIRSWIEADAIPEDADLTKQLVAEDMWEKDAGMKDFWLKNPDLEVMLCIVEGDNIYAIPVMLEVARIYDHVSVEDVFADDDGERVPVGRFSSVGYKEEKIDDLWYYTEIITYYLEEGYGADDEYSVGMVYFDSATRKQDASKVDKAVVGHYYSLEEAKSAPDIKKELFPDDIYEAGTGYKADFSGEGVNFTVFAGDEIWHFVVIVRENNLEDEPEDGGEDEEEPEYDEAPEIGVYDRYFRVDELYNEDNRLDTYTVPHEYDTYYSYGYQTLLINDFEADMSAISPMVNLGDYVKVYYGGAMEVTNADDYYNRLLPRDFTKVPTDTTRDPYNSAKYTVSTKDHTNQKNYWVTAVKKEEGAKLFVNGPDEREIFLNNYFGNVHDIFVANVGGEELTGITATIDATNVKLDDYWTLGGDGNDTLAPFTATLNYTGNYKGDLANIAKIRLVPDGEGEIEGTLTITADGQEPRVITLKGTAGNPKIDTETIQDAVKYVPYSAIITTNNMHDWNKVKFSVYEGGLPKGLTLYPSGEIYGVPKETGEFPVTIKATYSHSEFEASYADIVITVQDNTDANINASVDDGYEITTRLPAKISKYADMDFVIDGEFSEFVDLWLDGEKLIKDTDYTAISGSTKITVKSKTFSNVGEGKHTISAEFRVGGDKNNELKTASQNFTIGKATSSGGGGGGGGGSVASYYVTFNTNGGSEITKQSIKKGKTIAELPTPEKEGYIFAGWFIDKDLTQAFAPETKITSRVNLYAKWDEIVPEEPVATKDFADVTTADWFYEDVQWAYTNKIMVGYDDAQFAPDETITSSMVVTVLARLANVDITEYEGKHNEDVDDDQWYTPYAIWAKEAGIAEDISFISPAEISREMMGVVLVRFFDYMEKDFAVTQEFVRFADADDISPKAMNSVQMLYKLGILKGKGDNKIDPLGNTTRAEFSALIHRVCALLDK